MVEGKREIEVITNRARVIYMYVCFNAIDWLCRTKVPFH